MIIWQITWLSDCLLSCIATLTGKNGPGPPPHTVYITSDGVRSQIIPCSLEDSLQVLKVRQVRALVYPVHPKCVRLGINPGCRLAIGERLCCDAEELAGLSCWRVTCWACLWMNGAASGARIWLIYPWAFKLTFTSIKCVFKPHYTAPYQNTAATKAVSLKDAGISKSLSSPKVDPYRPYVKPTLVREQNSVPVGASAPVHSGGSMGPCQNLPVVRPISTYWPMPSP